MRTTTRLFNALGTANVIRVNSESMNTDRMLDSIENRLSSYDDRWSVFKTDSLVSRISFSEVMLEVDGDTEELIQESVRCGNDTDGCFDVTSLALNRLWKRKLKGSELPAENEICEARRLVDFRKIELKNRSVNMNGMGLDLGGIAKGFLLAKTVEMLKAEGIKSATISLGGAVYALGRNVIGIRNPFLPVNRGMAESSILKIEAADEAIITSGVYEQETIINGRKYSHIINPQTGYPAETDLRSVTLIGTEPAMLDGYATAFIIMGMEESMKLIKKKELEAIFILNDGKIFATDGIGRRIAGKRNEIKN